MRADPENTPTLNDRHYKAAFENAAVGISILRLDGTRINVNDKLCQILGKSREELLQKSIWDNTNLDDVPGCVDLFKKLLAGDLSSYECEKRIVLADGSERWVKVTGSLCHADDQEEPTVVVFLEDVDKQKNIEFTGRFLNAEVNHRTRNLLAVILGMIRKLEQNTTTSEDITTAIRKRIFALNASYNLLSQTEWSRPTLQDILTEIISALFQKHSERIRIHTERIEIAPQIAVNLGLMFYELISNAIQHGALSHSAGVVDVTASTRVEQGETILNIRWEEMKGPVVSEPAHKGFGLFMLEKGVASGMSGSCKVDFRPEGLALTMMLPLPQATAHTERSKVHGT